MSPCACYRAKNRFVSLAQSDLNSSTRIAAGATSSPVPGQWCAWCMFRILIRRKPAYRPIWSFRRPIAPLPIPNILYMCVGSLTPKHAVAPLHSTPREMRLHLPSKLSNRFALARRGGGGLVSMSLCALAVRIHLHVHSTLRDVAILHVGSFPDGKPVLSGDPRCLQGCGCVHDHHTQGAVGVAPHGIMVLDHQYQVLQLHLPTIRNGGARER